MRERLKLLAALLAVASVTGTAFTQAQDKSEPDTLPAHPRFLVLHSGLTDAKLPPPANLATWTGSYTYKGKKYSYEMVGKVPSSGKSTTIAVYIIPIILKIKSGSTTYAFSPETVQSNGLTAVQNTLASPIFQTMDWVSPGGVDLGTTQYEDAFQRGNFWGTVSTKTGYHVLLGTPKVEPTQTFVVPASVGSVGTEFGVKAGLADINWFDNEIEPLMTSLKIPPSALPIFITYDVYLTDDGCCIGGYHNYNGTQTYAHFTYVGKAGAFAEDVDALSHEVGEWIDDPLGENTDVPLLCAEDGNQSQILEVGDPEEVDAGYGAFPYTLGGFTYHLQDLTYLPYFGAPVKTSVDDALTFHDNPFNLTVCSNGG
jgi:hypothetical protein